MDTKEMLQKAITKTIEQGVPCGRESEESSNGFVCFYTYEDEDGNTLHCTAGHILEISSHEEEMKLFGDAVPIGSEKAIRVLENKLGRKAEREEVEFLEEIQGAHDDNADCANFVAGFKESIEHSVDRGLLPEYCLEFIA